MYLCIFVVIEYSNGISILRFLSIRNVLSRCLCETPVIRAVNYDVCTSILFTSHTNGKDSKCDRTGAASAKDRVGARQGDGRGGQGGEKRATGYPDLSEGRLVCILSGQKLHRKPRPDRPIAYPSGLHRCDV